MLLLTPDRIRTLQRKLYIKAKQEPAYRFYALYDKLYQADILHHAWRLVKANKGSPGVDGMSFEVIESGIGVGCYLELLSRELQDKTYQANPVRRVMIPKADGSLRPLGIPTIRDRVVQMALKLVIEPIFEADFCEHSYGFRPQKSAHQAIDAIADGAVLALIKQWLKAPVIGESENGKTACVGGGKSNQRGTPQGGVISPLLSNLYLHLLDRIWQRHELARKLQAKLVRYADDFVVLCRKDVVTPLATIRCILEKLELNLNESKTKIVDANKEEFYFLGFALKVKVSSKGKRYPHVNPKEQAVEKVKNRINEITARNQTWRPIQEVVRELNQVLRGWSGYFHYRNSSLALSKVKRHAEDRLRIHLRKRHKVRNWKASMLRFPRRVLYEEYGLYKVPIVAGWKSAVTHSKAREEGHLL